MLALVLLLASRGSAAAETADLSLLQLRAAGAPLAACEEGHVLHKAVKMGHGVDWTDPEAARLPLGEDDRTEYDQVMGSLADGVNPEVFVLFFGYARSGHSMVGSLLDAHPNAAVANEFDAIGAYQNGDSRDLLFRNLVAVSTAYKLVGRCQAGYHFDVPGVVVQPFEPGKLRVVGDKDGGCNARKQLNILELVEFQRYVGLNVSLIHVVRNPFDIVATSFAANTKDLVARWKRQHDARLHAELAEHPAEVEGSPRLVADLEKYVDLVVQEMTYNMKVRDWIATGKLPNYRWEDVALADFVRDPRGQLGRLCGFLGLDCEAADFAARAASIVRRSEHASRDELIWPPATYDRLREAVAKVRAKYPDGAHLWTASPPRHIGAFKPPSPG